MNSKSSTAGKDPIADSAAPPSKRRRRLRRTSRYQPGLTVGKWTKIRFYGVGGIITLCFLGVSYRAYQIQVRDQEHYRALAERQHLRTIEVPAPRGTIVDRNGAELAVNADVDSVFANPRAIVDLTSTSEQLALILALDIRTVEARLATRRYFAWIKRHVSPPQAAAIRKLKLKGVSLTKEPRRYYPGKRLAGNILGFAGIDGRGLDGLELAMNGLLTGKRAEVASLRDASGRIMIDDPKAVAHAGASITLTIDRTIQFAAERAIREAVLKNQAKSAVAVVQDVRNGDILALASYPDVDPNSPADSPAEGRRNRAVTDSYEVGSVMKVFSIAAALEAGVVRPSTIINTEKGRFRIGRKVFHDSFHDEQLDVGGVLKRSSNVGALKIAQRLGAEALHAAFVRFGFGARTGIELPGEVSGVLHPAKRWGELGLATHAFGYGMTSTPLQVTAAMAAVGNHGVYFEPRLIKAVTGDNGEPLYTREPKGRRVLSKKTADSLMPMLESVFEGGKQHGTARALFVPGYRVAGKTGTSHKIDPATHRYGEHLYLASFSGLAPAQSPRIAVTVLVDEPRGEEHYGGKVAGPAWTQIVGETLAVLALPSDAALLVKQLEAKKKLDRRLAWRLGIDPDKIERARKRNEVALFRRDDQQQREDELQDFEGASPMADLAAGMGEASPQGQEADQVRVPDFTGMGLAKALATAKRAGLKVELLGSGCAIDQSPPPGPSPNPGVIQITFTSGEHAFSMN